MAVPSHQPACQSCLFLFLTVMRCTYPVNKGVLTPSCGSAVAVLWAITLLWKHMAYRSLACSHEGLGEEAKGSSVWISGEGIVFRKKKHNKNKSEEDVNLTVEKHRTPEKRGGWKRGISRSTDVQAALSTYCKGSPSNYTMWRQNSWFCETVNIKMNLLGVCVAPQISLGDILYLCHIPSGKKDADGWSLCSADGLMVITSLLFLPVPICSTTLGFNFLRLS